MRLDARVAGAWGQPPSAIVAAWDDVRGRVEAITASVPAGTELEDLDVPQRYTLGVFFAARWTLGLVGHRPLAGVDAAVTELALRAELDVAEYLIVSSDPTWDLAAGVRAWIGWIVGVKDELPYPHHRTQP